MGLPALRCGKCKYCPGQDGCHNNRLNPGRCVSHVSHCHRLERVFGRGIYDLLQTHRSLSLVIGGSAQTNKASKKKHPSPWPIRTRTCTKGLANSLTIPNERAWISINDWCHTFLGLCRSSPWGLSKDLDSSRQAFLFGPAEPAVDRTECRAKSA